MAPEAQCAYGVRENFWSKIRLNWTAHMRIAVAQLRPVGGDITGNTVRHKALIDQAASTKADIIIFPELSLTGYEPELAGELALQEKDPRLDVFQALSATHRLTIGVGAPIQSASGVSIGLVLFHPGLPRQVYYKEYLHPDEEPFFVRGINESVFLNGYPEVALAICYELSVPGHAAEAHAKGAKIYVASVAKTAGGVKKAYERLFSIAREHTMTVLMANCVGLCDGQECTGGSAIWNSRGELVSQLNAYEEGILLHEIP